MVEAEEDFDFESNFDDILNDYGLNSELLALGWTEDEEVHQKVFKKEESIKLDQFRSVANNSNFATSFFDSSENLLDSDETDITLTAEDMEDPELLAQFSQLHQPTAMASNISKAAVIPTTIKPNSTCTKTLQLNLTTSATEAKSMALKFKREGNDAEALRWYRIAKQNEQNEAVNNIRTRNVLSEPDIKTTLTNLNKQAPKDSTNKLMEIPPNVLSVASSNTSSLKLMELSLQNKGNDSFVPLEEALNEASQASLREAKRMEHSDPKMAIQKMKEYKAHQQDLVVLRSRREVADAKPTLFRWQINRRSMLVEHLELGEDQLRLTIESAHDLESVLDGHSGRTISVSCILGLGSSSETIPVPLSTPQCRYENGKVNFNYQVTLPVIKRGRHVQQQYARKKATFELTLHRGFFKSNVSLCQAVLPLGDLLTRTEIGGHIPLVSVGVKEGDTSTSSSAKKGRAVGGTLKVLLRVRSALLTPEVLISEDRVLVVDPWPSTSSRSSAVPVEIATDSSATASKPKSFSVQTTTCTSSPDPRNNPIFASISDRDRLDPLSPDLMDSNDVLEAEIAQAEESLARLGQGASGADGLDAEDLTFALNMRLTLLRGKLQILVYNVQNDLLSMEDYLASLHRRVASDQLLAVYLKATHQHQLSQASRVEEDSVSNRDSLIHALQVMRRVNIMKEEIRNAAEQQQGDGDSDEKNA